MQSPICEPIYTQVLAAEEHSPKTMCSPATHTLPFPHEPHLEVETPSRRTAWSAAAESLAVVLRFAIPGRSRSFSSACRLPPSFAS
ncbi:hypothetical protein ACFX2G_015119 [Malus domestica]